MPTAPFFNKDNARLYAAQGVAARMEAKRKLVELAALAVAQAEPGADTSYQAKRLARVRLQLDRLSDMLDKEKDPRLIDRLTAAIDRLGKHEQFLSGRPGPGTLKPSSKPAKPSRREVAPQPLPVVEQTKPVHDPLEPNG